jgi:NAD(P)H-hydrate epimerase
MSRADAVLDAVLGTGRARPLEGALAATLVRLQALRDGPAERRPIFYAIDLPTGVDADTGATDPYAAAVDATFALGFSKVGLHTLPGSACAGRVEVLDIGLDPDAGADIRTELLTRDWARAHLPSRPQASNKGSFGRVLIVAGSERYTGAASLTALGALRAGAGLVTLASIGAVRQSVSALVPEVTHMPLPEAEGALDTPAGDLIARALPGFRALVIGPGLGLAPGTQAVVRSLLTSPAAEGQAVVVDADGLNVLARHHSWWTETKAHLVLTPHPGELSRLTSRDVESLQERRLDAAREAASRWRQVVVLKGAHTVVAAPDGRALISPFATAALATAGTGDVLAGAIAGLLAQGVERFEAAALAVYLHGAAAGEYEDVYGEAGLLASEVASGIARAAAKLRTGT